MELPLSQFASFYASSHDMLRFPLADSAIAPGCTLLPTTRKSACSSPIVSSSVNLVPPDRCVGASALTEPNTPTSSTGRLKGGCSFGANVRLELWEPAGLRSPRGGATRPYETRSAT